MGGKKITEADIVPEVRMAADECGAILWRNNTGAYKDKGGRFIRYGLCVGSADWVGIWRGRFLAVECKAPGKKPTPEQISFIDAVNAAGGIAFIATCSEDVYAKLRD